MTLVSLALAGFSAARAAEPPAPPPSPSPSPSPSVASGPEATFARAQDVYRSDGPKAALPLLEQAREELLAARDELKASVALGLMGNCYKHLGEYGKARQLLERTLAEKRRLKARLEEGKTLGHLGLLSWEEGDYRAAVTRLEEALAVGLEQGDDRLQSVALNNLALVHDERGEYARSRERYSRALAIARRIGDRASEGSILANLAGVDYLLGDFRASIAGYELSLAVSRELGAKPAQSQALGNLAQAHLWVDQVPEALALLDQALPLAREAGLHKEQADWLRFRASALARRGELGSALASFREALAVYQGAGMKREEVDALVDIARVRLEFGETLASRGELEAALRLAEAIGYAKGVLMARIALGDLEHRLGQDPKALAHWKHAQEKVASLGDRGEEASLLLHLGVRAIAAGRLDEAKPHLEASRTIARAQGMRSLEAAALGALAGRARAEGQLEPSLALYEKGIAIARDLGSPEVAWPLFHGQAKALEGLGRREPAAAAYRAAIDEIEKVRGGLRDDALRSGYMEQRCTVYADLARLLILMGRVGEAFGYVERQRSRAYLDRLGGKVAAGLATSAAFRAQERDLRRKIERLTEQMETEHAAPGASRRAGAVTTFNHELAETQRRYTLLLADLRAADPTYAALVTTEAPDTAAVQRRLGPDTALVAYFLAADALHVFVLDGEHLAHVSRAITPERLQARVALLRDRLAAGGEDWRGPARKLWEDLIAPAESTGLLAGKTRLYLVPEGSLHHLPFAVLVAPEGSPRRYLVERFALAELPAASTLLAPPRERREPVRALAFAPQSAHLEFAATEASAVGRRYGAGSQALLGPEATERRCKERSASYTVLHFATHAELDPLNPLFSYVVLEPGQGDDGRLHVFEVLDLRLDTDLVTLSGCSTAVGSGHFRDLPAGDDLVSLSRAFLTAGAASVVASLWELDDRGATTMMGRFYGRLAGGGADKAEALARTQRELLAAGGPLASPKSWASFILVGAMR